MRDRNLLRAILIGSVLLLSYAYFYQGSSGDWNQNARFDLTRAIVEEHTFYIDDYRENTGSRAVYRGHYYSDKAPGLSFLAVPAWAMARAWIAKTGIPAPNSRFARGLPLFAATLGTVALPTALAAVCIFLLAVKLGASESGAAFAALVFGLGTPMWGYATLFRSHATVSALLLFAFTVTLAVRRFHAPRRDVLLGIAFGLCAGWAVVTEYPATVAAAILAILAVTYAWSRGPAPKRYFAAGMAAGAILCAGVVMGYQQVVFGSPFRVSYTFTTYALPPSSPEMGDGLFGLTYPRWWIVRELLLGHYRGLLLLAPVLTLAPLGFVQLWRCKPTWREGLLAAAAICTYYLLLNASYKYWDGGYSIGPRHLSPALPFLCLALGMLWNGSGQILRIVLGILALCGVALALMAVSTDATPATDVKSPLQELIWPAFRSGHLSIRDGTMNLGQIAGLHGLASLAPLLLVWILGVTAWMSLGRLSSPQKPAPAETKKPMTQIA